MRRTIARRGAGGHFVFTTWDPQWCVVLTEELEAPDPRQLCFVYRNMLPVRSQSSQLVPLSSRYWEIGVSCERISGEEILNQFIILITWERKFVRVTGHQSSKYMILDCFRAGTRVNVLKHDCRQGKRGVEYVWKHQPTGSQMLWGQRRECILDLWLCGYSGYIS